MILTNINRFQQNGCFAVGTLIHTKTGLKPIEDIQIGDWVLAKPENGHGAQAYKRVVRTVQFENKSVVRIDCSTSHGSESFIVTGNHPFWVVGYEPDYFPPDWDGPRETGWMRADRLDRGLLVLLANGEIGYVSSVDPIWRTQTEGVGWIDLGRESYAQDTGYLINLREGKIKENYHESVISDFLDEDGFLDRYNHEELAEDWAYKCPVYNLEIEDFHTYFVGELGVLVHDMD